MFTVDWQVWSCSACVNRHARARASPKHGEWAGAARRGRCLPGGSKEGRGVTVLDRMPRAVAVGTTRSPQVTSWALADGGGGWACSVHSHELNLGTVQLLPRGLREGVHGFQKAKHRLISHHPPSGLGGGSPPMGSLWWLTPPSLA